MSYIDTHIGGIRFTLQLMEVAAFVVIACAVVSIAVSLRKRSK